MSEVLRLLLSPYPAPVNILTGGVHGDRADAWLWSIVLLNGIAHVLISLLLGRVKQFFVHLRKAAEQPDYSLLS